MQTMTTIDLPRDNPSTRYQTYPNHCSYYVSKPGCALLFAADDPEEIATWFERLAADVRSKSFDADVSAATLSAVQGDHVGEGVAGEPSAPSCHQDGCTPSDPCAVCRTLAGAQGGER